MAILFPSIALEVSRSLVVSKVIVATSRLDETRERVEGGRVNVSRLEVGRLELARDGERGRLDVEREVGRLGMKGMGVLFTSGISAFLLRELQSVWLLCRCKEPRGVREGVGDMLYSEFRRLRSLGWLVLPWDLER